MNAVKLRLSIEKLRESGECRSLCNYNGKDYLCDHIKQLPTDAIGSPLGKCKISTLLFKSKTGLDGLYKKDKELLQNLQYSTEKLCITCANIICYKTHAKGLTGPCKYWKPQILLDYPELSNRIKLEGVTKHPKKVGEVGYAFKGQLSNIKELEISISVGTFSRGMSGGSYVYRLHSKNITTRPFFYTLKELGYE